MANQGVQTLSCVHMPYSDGRIEGATDNVDTIKLQRVDSVWVACKCMNALLCFWVPHFNDVVISTAYNAAAVILHTKISKK